MYITNKPKVAKIAEAAGTDIVFVDMEYIGKDDRQGGLNTVQNHHTPKDVANMKNATSEAKIMVRVNPIHEANSLYPGTEKEVNQVVEAGADIIMLPYFKTVNEVERFIQAVNGRAETMLLLETSNAAKNIDEILKVPGIDNIHIGLNDMSLCYGMKFMFELMENGLVEQLCKKIAKTNIKYGIGGIAAIGEGMLPTEYVIREHYRLGSTAAILSRSFCNTDIVTDLAVVKEKFEMGIADIRALEKECQTANSKYFTDNKKELDAKINAIKQRLYN